MREAKKYTNALERVRVLETIINTNANKLIQSNRKSELKALNQFIEEYRKNTIAKLKG